MRIFKTLETPKIIQNENISYVCDYCNTCYETETKARNCEFDCKQKQCKHKFRAVYPYREGMSSDHSNYYIYEVQGECTLCSKTTEDYDISKEGLEDIQKILNRELRVKLRNKK